ncbi:NB-ARC domain-containing protein, partial [Kibdelosporangium lantanae]
MVMSDVSLTNVSLETFGKLLRDERMKRRRSLRAVGNRGDFHFTYLSKVEQGARQVTEPIVRCYDKALGTDLLEVFNRLSSPPPPATLPNVAPVLGRDEELAKIIDMLTPRTDRPTCPPTVVVISGSYGVGKSALAVTAASAVREHYPDGVVYVDLDGYGRPGHAPVGPAEVLVTLLHALNVTNVGDSFAERVQQYRNALATRGGRERRVLIVLDNARNARQVQHLLPGTNAVAGVVITSRHRLIDLMSVLKVWIPLQPLSPQLSTEALTWMVAGHHPLADSEGMMSHLALLCGGYPLLLRLVAEHLSMTSPAVSATDLRQQFATFASADLPRQLRDHLAGELATASDEATRLIWLWGVWRPAAVPLSGAALAALCGRPLPETRRLIAELVDANIVCEVSDDRYSLTVLMASYAAGDPNGSAADRRAAAHRLASWYLHSAAAAT